MHFSVRLTLLHIAVYQISVESMQVLSPISPAYFARIDSKSRRGFLDNLRCAANPSNQNSQEDQFSSLVSWLQSGGGSVSCIEVTPNDPCGGGRGLIASADIEKGQELITVPQNMQVRTEQRGAGMIASLKFTNDSDPLRHLRLPRPLPQLAYGGGGDSDPALLRSIERVPPGLWAVRLGLKLLKERAAAASHPGTLLPSLPWSPCKRRTKEGIRPALLRADQCAGRAGARRRFSLRRPGRAPPHPCRRSA